MRVRVRVIADNFQNTAGQPRAMGRVYSGPAPATKSSKFKRSKSSYINFLPQLEDKLLNSAVQLALHRRTRRRPQQTVALQWEGNYLAQTRFLSLQTIASTSIRSCDGTRNLHDVHDAKKVLVPGVELDLSSLTALQRLPQERYFPSHFILCCTSQTGFYLKNKQNNPQSILLQKKKIENFNCL